MKSKITSKIFKRFSSNKKHFQRFGIATIIAGLVAGACWVPVSNSFNPSANNNPKNSNGSNSNVDNTYKTDDEIRQSFINKTEENFYYGMYLDDLDMDLHVPVAVGDSYRTELRDEYGDIVEVIDPNAGTKEPKMVIKKEAVYQKVAVDNASGRLTMPGNPNDIAFLLNMPVSYMDKVLLNIQTTFWNECIYCEYQGRTAKLDENGEEMKDENGNVIYEKPPYLEGEDRWEGRDTDHTIRWENIKFKVPTNVTSENISVKDPDGEVREIISPSSLDCIFSHMINFLVETNLLSTERVYNLIHGEEMSEEEEIEASKKNHVKPKADIDVDRLISNIENMEINVDNAGDIEYKVKIPNIYYRTTDGATKPEDKILYLKSTKHFDLKYCEFPYIDGENKDYYTITAPDIDKDSKNDGIQFRFKADFAPAADAASRVIVRDPEEDGDRYSLIYDPHDPNAGALGLFNSIAGFVAQPKLRYNTNIYLTHIIDGKYYEDIQGPNDTTVNFNDNCDIEWYKQKMIKDGISKEVADEITKYIRMDENKESDLYGNLLETMYFNANGATYIKEWDLNNIIGTVPDSMGYKINLGVVDYSNVQTPKEVAKHTLEYAFDSKATDFVDEGQGMGANYFKYDGVAQYKSSTLDFGRVLGQIMDAYNTFTEFSSDVKNDTSSLSLAKEDLWKYVDMLGKAKIRKTVAKLIEDGVDAYENGLDSLQTGNAKELTDLISCIKVNRKIMKVEDEKGNITEREIISGGETVIDFSAIGLEGTFKLITERNCAPMYTGLTVDDPAQDGKTTIEDGNDKFIWEFKDIKLGGFELNGTIDFIACNEEDEYFTKNYVDGWGPQTEKQKAEYKLVKDFNSTVDRIFNIRNSKNLAVRVDADAFETNSETNMLEYTDKEFGDIKTDNLKASYGGIRLRSKTLIDFDHMYMHDGKDERKGEIATSEVTIDKINPYFSSDAVTSRNGNRTQTFKAEVDVLSKKKYFGYDENNKPLTDMNGNPIYVTDNEESNVFLRCQSSGEQTRPHHAKPVEGYAAIQSYVDLFGIMSSVALQTPDGRFTKFLSMLSADVYAGETLDTVINLAKNGNVITPALSTHFIKHVEPQPENNKLIVIVNKAIANGRLANDVELTVNTVEREVKKTKEKHIESIGVKTKLAHDKYANGVTGYDGLTINLKVSFLDYDKTENNKKVNHVENNWKFTDKDAQGRDAHDKTNSNYVEFSSVVKVTQSALNAAWLGSGARYFNTNGSVRLRQTLDKNLALQKGDKANLLGNLPGKIVSREDEYGVSTYHIGVRFPKMMVQAIDGWIKGDFPLSLDIWIRLDGEKLKMLCLVNMPMQRGFNDKAVVLDIRTNYEAPRVHKRDRGCLDKRLYCTRLAIRMLKIRTAKIDMS